MSRLFAATWPSANCADLLERKSTSTHLTTMTTKLPSMKSMVRTPKTTAGIYAYCPSFFWTRRHGIRKLSIKNFYTRDFSEDFLTNFSTFCSSKMRPCSMTWSPFGFTCWWSGSEETFSPPSDISPRKRIRWLITTCLVSWFYPPSWGADMENFVSRKICLLLMLFVNKVCLKWLTCRMPCPAKREFLALLNVHLAIWAWSAIAVTGRMWSYSIFSLFSPSRNSLLESCPCSLVYCRMISSLPFSLCRFVTEGGG